MGKRIIQQARGKGGPVYRVRRKAYRYRITYPSLDTTGTGKVIQLLNSPAHRAPLAKIQINEEVFYCPAAAEIYEGKEIKIGEKRKEGKFEIGDIMKLGDIPIGTKVFNIESTPGNGGKFMRSGGCSAVIIGKGKEKVELSIGRRRVRLNKNCRAVIGVVAGDGRKMKPIVKAGKKHHMMKAIGRKWHRTSAVKVNAVDHPFGGGRGKRIKSKIAKRNAPPGKKVGHIRPRRTGKKK